MKTKMVVIGLVENDKHQFLISQRYEPKILEAHMKWDFPGGTIDFGETPEDALKREILEETGLNVAVHEMVPKCYSNVWTHEDFKVHAIVLCYRCKLIDGNLNLNDHKIHDLKWIYKNDFDKYDFLPSVNLFLKDINF